MGLLYLSLIIYDFKTAPCLELFVLNKLAGISVINLLVSYGSGWGGSFLILYFSSTIHYLVPERKPTIL